MSEKLKRLQQEIKECKVKVNVAEKCINQIDKRKRIDQQINKKEVEFQNFTAQANVTINSLIQQKQKKIDQLADRTQRSLQLTERSIPCSNSSDLAIKINDLIRKLKKAKTERKVGSKNLNQLKRELKKAKEDKREATITLFEGLQLIPNAERSLQKTNENIRKLQIQLSPLQRSFKINARLCKQNKTNVRQKARDELNKILDQTDGKINIINQQANKLLFELTELQQKGDKKTRDLKRLECANLGFKEA